MASEPEPEPRIIAAIDMDCFECQIYQKDNPKTKGKPCVAAQQGGRIVSVNYPAKKFKISRSHKVSEALRLCKTLQILKIPEKFGKPDNSKLRSESNKVFQVIQDYCDLNFSKDGYTLEKSSCDEYFLDISKEVNYQLDYWWKSFLLILFSLFCVFFFKKELVQYLIFAFLILIKFFLTRFDINFAIFLRLRLLYGKYLLQKICREIQTSTKMTASAGIATTIFQAKLASSKNKPDNKGYIIYPEGYRGFIGPLDIREVPGFKKKLGQMITDQLGISKVKQLLPIIDKLDIDKIVKASENLNNSDSLTYKEVKDRLKILKRGDDGKVVVQKSFPDSLSCRKKFIFRREKKTWWRYLIEIFFPAKKGKYDELNRQLLERCAEIHGRIKEERKRNKRTPACLKFEILYEVFDSSNSKKFSETVEVPNPTDRLPSIEFLSDKATKFSDKFQREVANQRIKITEIGLVIKKSHFVPYKATILERIWEFAIKYWAGILVIVGGMLINN